MKFNLESDFIRLGDLLKVCGLVDSGAQAKHVVQEGQVKVDGRVRTERGAKIVSGSKVEFDGKVIEVESK